MRRVSGAAALLAVLVLLVGCASASPAPAASEDMPRFEGPWAAQFEEVYRLSTTDLQRDVLADGQITELEASQLEDAFSDCIVGKGLQITWTADGGFAIDQAASPEDSNAAVKECNAATMGAVVGLHHEIRRNPDHLDEATIMAACLVREGLVAAGYTAADFTRDTQAQPPASFLSDQRTQRCASDPLGLKG